MDGRMSGERWVFVMGWEVGVTDDRGDGCDDGWVARTVLEDGHLAVLAHPFRKLGLGLLGVIREVVLAAPLLVERPVRALALAAAEVDAVAPAAQREVLGAAAVAALLRDVLLLLEVRRHRRWTMGGVGGEGCGGGARGVVARLTVGDATSRRHRGGEAGRHPETLEWQLAGPSCQVIARFIFPFG